MGPMGPIGPIRRNESATPTRPRNNRASSKYPGDLSMALDLTADQKNLGKANTTAAATELHRRGFMKSVAGGAAVVPVAAAAYFGYEAIHGKPVKAALIGCGDEGGVLLGEHDPK